MKLTRLQTYIIAWIFYLAFIFSMYPQLKITVMLFSIPLTMLGAWLYLYRGALLTILLATAAHFGLLSIYADDPALVLEAFNPFGIISQVIFSGCTALLKASQMKYRRLNESLEEIVAERTRDLDQLTEYLIDAQQLEIREFNASLFEKPYEELKSMLATSELLKQKLSKTNHPRENDAENISMIIRGCINQLRSIDDYSISSLPATDNITDAIANLIKQIEQVSEVDIQYQESPHWNAISKNLCPPLSEIIFEAVINALRHADPERITIGIETEESQTSIFIENDGKTLAVNFREGMGVPLMRYRAGKIGAKLTINPTPSNLTQVRCTLPSKA